MADRSWARARVVVARLLERRSHTESRRSSPIIPCDLACEAISALADGEEPPVPETTAAFHVAKCEHCREFQAGVGLLSRQMRVHAYAPDPRGEAAMLAVLGLTDAMPSPGGHVGRRSERLSLTRATQWAAGVVPLGVAVPALALGLFAHVHILPSHLPTPCTVFLVHHGVER